MAATPFSNLSFTSLDLVFATVAITPIYAYIAKSTPWSNDLSPDIPYNNQQTEIDIKRNIIALKRILASDVALGFRRIEWTPNTVYDEYRHDYSPTSLANSGAPFLFMANFYVMTSDNNIYKCISNNNNSPSTVVPSGDSVNVITTADGYKWKYMQTVSIADMSKFLTPDYLPYPTENATVKAAAIDGGILHCYVKTQGTGDPVSVSNIPVYVDGDGDVVTTATIDITTV